MVKRTVVGLIAALVMGLGAAANGAVVFQDDFSIGVNSDENWTASNVFIKRIFLNGECVVTNSSDSFSGFVNPKLPNKPVVFTVSTQITRSAATVVCGLAVGFDVKTNKSINFLISDNTVIFYKSGESPNGIVSSYIDAKVNTLTVSMNGSVCNVFVNNKFVTTFTYASTPGSDIAYIVYPGTTVNFDDFTITDTFTPGAKLTEYTDDFENGLKKDWIIYPPAGPVAVDGGKLKLKTLSSTNKYLNMLVDVSFTDFVGKAAFSHKSGSTIKPYGLLLEGDGDNQQATFAITAGKFFGAVATSDTFPLDQNTSIRGAAYTDPAGVVTYRIDTLEIIKRAGSNEYIFVANRDTLTRLTGITFPITKVGIFCQDSLDLTVDDFSFKPFPVAVKRPFITNRSPLKANQSAYRGLFVFDPLGRSVIANRVLGNKASSGAYFTKGQQKSQMMMIVKNQK